MTFKDIRKALVHVIIGVSWRFLVFSGVALCFTALMDLKKWHSSYAPSPAWAATVSDGRLEWSSIVSAAAEQMPPPARPYPTPATFYKAMQKYVKEHFQPTNKADGALIGEYRQLLDNRRETSHGLLQEIALRRDDLEERSLAMTKVSNQVIETRRRIREIEAQKKTRLQEEALTAEEKRLERLSAQKAALVAEIRDEHSARELRFQKPLADLDARIKATEEKIREAFDAAVSSARPVGGPITRIVQPKYAIRIGDEKDPLHILYVVTWYFLEALIALLVCIVIVPWLVRLGGDTSDPNALRSTITTRIKGWLSEAFGPRAAAATGRVVATAAVASLTLAGVAVASGEQPSLSPTVLHDDPGAAARGAQNGQGQSGSVGAPSVIKGDDGSPGNNGTAGANGLDGNNVIPSELRERLDAHESELVRQAALLEALRQDLVGLSGKVTRTEDAVQSLDATVVTLSRNLSEFSASMGSFSQNLAATEDSIFGLTISNRSMAQAMNGTNQLLLLHLNDLSNTTRRTNQSIETVQEAINQAAKDLPPLAGQLMSIEAIPDGALTRANPLHRYAVSQEVIDLVRRAMGGPEDPVDPGEQEIVAALKGMQSSLDPKGVTRRRFCKELQNRTGDLGKKRLSQWISLIVKVSRVQD